jgi:hypothetical protein
MFMSMFMSLAFDMAALLGRGMAALLGRGMASLLGRGMPALLGRGMPALLGRGMAALLGRGMVASLDSNTAVLLPLYGSAGLGWTGFYGGWIRSASRGTLRRRRSARSTGGL